MMDILSFGGSLMMKLFYTHVHDTGLLLTDSGGSPTLQFHEYIESVSSDGSKLILTSNSVAKKFTNLDIDGSNGQVLKTNGSGTLSFGQLINRFCLHLNILSLQGQTSFSGNDDNSNSLINNGVNAKQCICKCTILC